jgi:glycosyltransferase involved in cell wall biosynthesis
MPKRPKVALIMPPNVKDFYGESAFILMHKLTKFDSVVDFCDDTIDIIFCTAFVDYYDKKLNIIFEKTYENNQMIYKKKYPNKIYINNLWDLPFWRAEDTTKKRKHFFFKEPSWKERYMAHLKSGDVVLSASQQTRSEVLKYYRIDSRVLYFYAPNIDIDGISNGNMKKKQIICVGRIEPFKKADILIKALSLIENPPELLLVGKGSERDSCLKLAKELNVKVNSQGWLDRVKTIKEIKSSIFSVNPSVFEGDGGWSPCEAVWAGIPSIVADIPVTREFYGDKWLYFKADDPASLAKQIKILLNKNQKQREEIQQAQKKQISFYTVEEGIKRLENFIEEVACKYL